MPITISPQDPAVEVDGEIHLYLQGATPRQQLKSITWTVLDENTHIGIWADEHQPEARWQAIGVQPGEYVVRADFTVGDKSDHACTRIVVHARAVRLVGPVKLDGPVRVDLQRAGLPRHAGSGAVGGYQARDGGDLLRPLRGLDGLPLLPR